MKQFRYEVYDECGLLRGYDAKWDAYNHVGDDKTMWVKVNPKVKVNRFLEAFKSLGEALI
jgi:hypothetical protein